MKTFKLFFAVVLLAIVIGIPVYYIGYALHDEYKERQAFSKRVDEMNAHIKQLHEDGYSWEVSRKIGATEAGFIPMDSEYKSLKAD